MPGDVSLDLLGNDSLIKVLLSQVTSGNVRLVDVKTC
jgi:hypothetical protein